MPSLSHQQTVNRVSLAGIAVNAVLTAFKLAAGLLSASTAMISDAIHSASDILTTIIVILGVRMSAQAADREHPYGHERFECIASILLALFLGAVGCGIGYAAVVRMAGGNGGRAAPGLLALIAAVISIVAKEALYHYTMRAGKRIDSSALKADAWHHRSDALSSVGSFLGILGARLGLPILDPLAGLIICVIILKVAVQIFLESCAKMTDHACDEQTTAALRSLILAQDGVLGLDDMKTRIFSSRIYVDIEIAANGNQKLLDAHRIAEHVHDAVEEQFPNVKHCMVHVNPTWAPEAIPGDSTVRPGEAPQQKS